MWGIGGGGGESRLAAELYDTCGQARLSAHPPSTIGDPFRPGTVSRSPLADGKERPVGPALAKHCHRGWPCRQPARQRRIHLPRRATWRRAGEAGRLIRQRRWSAVHIAASDLPHATHATGMAQEIYVKYKTANHRQPGIRREAKWCCRMTGCVSDQ